MYSATSTARAGRLATHDLSQPRPPTIPLPSSTPSSATAAFDPSSSSAPWLAASTGSSTDLFDLFDRQSFARGRTQAEDAAFSVVMRQATSSARGGPASTIDDRKQRINLLLPLLVYTHATARLQAGEELPAVFLEDASMREALKEMPRLIQRATEWEAQRRLWESERLVGLHGSGEVQVSEGGVVVDPGEYVETGWRLRLDGEEGMGIPEYDIAFMGPLPNYAAVGPADLQSRSIAVAEEQQPSEMDNKMMYQGLDRLAVELGIFEAQLPESTFDAEYLPSPPESIDSFIIPPGLLQPSALFDIGFNATLECDSRVARLASSAPVKDVVSQPLEPMTTPSKRTPKPAVYQVETRFRARTRTDSGRQASQTGLRNESPVTVPSGSKGSSDRERVLGKRERSGQEEGDGRDAQMARVADSDGE